jgi:hypothetical protein
VNAKDLVLALISILVVSIGAYLVARVDDLPTSQAVRMTLWSLVGGLALYLGYAINLPGATWLHTQFGWLAPMGAGFVGGILPTTITLILKRYQQA